MNSSGLLLLGLVFLLYIYNRSKYRYSELFIFFYTFLKILLYTEQLYDIQYINNDGIVYYNKLLEYKNSGLEALEYSKYGFTGWVVPGTGLMLYIVSSIVGSVNPHVLVSMNHIFVLFSALIWIRLHKYGLIAIISSLILVISPEISHYSSGLFKDASLLFITVSILYLISKKRLLFSIITLFLIIIGSMMRPYFITSVIAYLVFLNYFNKKQLLLLYIIGSICSVFIFLYIDIPFNLYIILRNLFLTLFGFILSPNFLRSINWELYTFATLQSLLSLTLIIYFTIKHFNVAKVILYKYILAILVYVAPVTMVFIQVSMHYSDIILFATEIPRTRTPIVLIMYYLISTMIVYLFSMAQRDKIRLWLYDSRLFKRTHFMC